MIAGKLYLMIGSTIFFLSLFYLYNNKKNALITLLSLELLSISISFIFITYSVLLNDIEGQLIALIILAVSGAESAIALALFLAFFRTSGTISILSLNQLKG
jgi:NADH-quinone oxidoreductase subunit K